MRRLRIAVSFDIVKVSRAVRFQTRNVFVPVQRHVSIVVEVLVDIRFTVVIQISQTCDLVPTDNVDMVVDNLQPEWLKEACCESSPGEAIERRVDSVNQPDIAVKITDSSAAILKEVVAAAKKEGIEPVFKG